VIVGGGFAGLSAARALRSAPVDVTVVDRRNYHLFQPLLYQVATGSLSPGEIAAPLRGVLGRQRNTRVLLGHVVNLDPTRKPVLLADGASLEYEALVIAVGSQTSYFGHDTWKEWAPGLKSVDEAVNVRHKILYAFEVAERIPDPAERQAWLTFVIVGAGPSLARNATGDGHTPMSIFAPASTRTAAIVQLSMSVLDRLAQARYSL